MALCAHKAAVQDNAGHVAEIGVLQFVRRIGGKSSYYLRSDCFGFGRKGCKDRKGV